MKKHFDFSVGFVKFCVRIRLESSLYEQTDIQRERPYQHCDQAEENASTSLTSFAQAQSLVCRAKVLGNLLV